MAEQVQTIGVVAAGKQPELVKGLGLFDSTMIVVGSMIGSGIFIVSADIAHQVQSPGLLLVVWLAAGADDFDRRAQLWRARRGHAACRRSVRLLARVARAALGISLRLDDAARDPDGYDRRGGDRLCQIHGGDRAVVFAPPPGSGRSARSGPGSSGSARSGPTTSA